MSDPVNHPSHYGGADNVYEAIKVIEAWQLDFCLGNAVKYIARHAHKGRPLEDLRKARWYLERAIQNLEKGEQAVSPSRIVHFRDRVSDPVACGRTFVGPFFDSANARDVTCSDCLLALEKKP